MCLPTAKNTDRQRRGGSRLQLPLSPAQSKEGKWAGCPGKPNHWAVSSTVPETTAPIGLFITPGCSPPKRDSPGESSLLDSLEHKELRADLHGHVYAMSQQRPQTALRFILFEQFLSFLEMPSSALTELWSDNFNPSHPCYL